MAIQRLASIPPSDVGLSTISARYLAQAAKGIPPYLPPVERNPWAAQAAAIGERERGDASAWGEVTAAVVDLSRRSGACAEVIDKLAKAPSGETLFVVTGQQPGALGGPLHTAYKLATAIAVAAKAEAALGRPVVPLYWCGSDDADFHEVRELTLVTDAYSVITTVISQAAYRAGELVGAIAVDSLRELWAGVQQFAERFPCGAMVRRYVDDAFDTARDHGELAAGILVRLFGGRVAVVDGRLGAVRRCAQPLIVDYLTREDEAKALVASRGDRLEADGYHAQLTPGEDSGVFLMEDGLRKSVAPTDREKILEAARRDVERCSPGVVLRNLVQDEVFRPLAVVLGPAELAYRAQIAPLYDTFNIHRPLALPRLTATWVPPRVNGLVGEVDGFSAEVLMRDPTGFKTHLYERSLPEHVREAVDQMRHSVRGAMDAVTGEADASLPKKVRQRIRGRAGEVLKRVDGVADAVYEAGKAIALERWPFVAELEHVIKPDGKLQERVLSAMAPFLDGNERTHSELVELAASFTDELVDGRAAHIVYST